MKCHNCEKPLADEAMFCRYCGSDQSKRPVMEPASPEPQNEIENTKNICAKCGAEILDLATFCRNCGTKVVAAPVAADVLTAQAPLQITLSTPPMPDPTASPKPGIKQNEVPPQGQSSHTKRNAAIALIAITLFGGIGYWGWMNHLKAESVALQLVEEQKLKVAEEEAQQALATKLAALQVEEQAAQQAKSKQELGERLASEEAQKRPKKQAETKVQIPPKEKASADKLQIPRSQPIPKPVAPPAAAPAKPQDQPSNKPKSVKEVCADRPNFISRGLCESRFCKNPEWIESAFCVELNNREKSRNEF
jgi:ribosomal protein L40E